MKHCFPKSMPKQTTSTGLQLGKMVNMARSRLVAAASLFAAAWIMLAAGEKVDINNLITGPAAFLDYRGIKPGGFRKITADDLPEPFATRSANNAPSVIARPANAWPQAPAGFQVDLYATGLDLPREIRTAPNGDFFVAESDLGQIKIFRGRDKDGKPEQVSVFATGLQSPFGIAFYPPGPNPQWVYVGNTGSVVRFSYKNGDLKAGGPAQTIVPQLPPGGGHWTRDLQFTADGKKMFAGTQGDGSPGEKN